MLYNIIYNLKALLNIPPLTFYFTEHPKRDNSKIHKRDFVVDINEGLNKIRVFISRL